MQTSTCVVSLLLNSDVSISLIFENFERVTSVLTSDGLQFTRCLVTSGSLVDNESVSFDVRVLWLMTSRWSRCWTLPSRLLPTSPRNSLSQPTLRLRSTSLERSSDRVCIISLLCFLPFSMSVTWYTLRYWVLFSVCLSVCLVCTLSEQSTFCKNLFTPPDRPRIWFSTKIFAAIFPKLAWK